MNRGLFDERFDRDYRKPVKHSRFMIFFSAVCLLLFIYALAYMVLALIPLIG